jgi:hypothetical protein
MHGGDEQFFKILVGTPEWKIPLARLNHRWEDNIKMDLAEIGCGCVDGFDWLRIEISDKLL